jgi:asparagine synthase (glutamine-hydrolysing)
MCGIAGSVNLPLNIPVLTRDLLHRGPDEQATFQSNGLLFHHHRLAILDIACGKQPMDYEHLTIIFNGEIYNHQDLRKKYGLQCKTNSDTETLLQLYARLGASFLNDLDGMFALAIYDKKNHEVFIARDRAGKKPLYYYHDGKHFLFSSELNALRNQLDLSINEENIHLFVRMGYFYKTNTPYKNVYELSAGHYCIVNLDNTSVKITQWFNIHDFYSLEPETDFDAALQKTDDFLHQAIKRRLESSDLEVGSFLSGGIDSGIITAIAKTYNSTLKTFTVAFEGKYNEAPLAKLVADRYQTDHTEINISYDHLVSDIETILSNYGEPFFDNSAIPSYYVSKEAKKYLTVILNGDGGDEMFGGYRRYVPFARHDFFRSNMVTRGLAGLLNNIIPHSHDKQNKYNYLYRLTDLARKKDVHVYLSATMDSFESYENFLTAPEDILRNIRKDFNVINHSALSGLKKIMNLDFDNILGCSLLVKMDIATMAHSLEGRSPMLCKEILEYVPSLPDKFKVRNNQTKYILRKLAEKYLPPVLINQPKRGFESPLKQWVNGELKNLIGDYILKNNSYCRNYIKPGIIESIWNRKIGMGEEKRAKMIWTLFALEIWHSKCYLQTKKL